VAESTDIKFDIAPDAEALALKAAEWLLDTARAKSSPLAIALSGGSTPRRLYRHLASPPYREAFPWSQVHWFWGDERFVPADDPQSNYRMVRETLLSQVPIPPSNVHRVVTDGLGLAEAAASYEREIKSFYGADRIDPARPIFDVTLLGLGPDGHTASLFPGSVTLQEQSRWVAAVSDSQLGPRITLTYPALNSSRQAAFLIEGDEKREILGRFRQGDRTLPATRVRPAGALWVFTDKAALPESAA
jgi:6-phosphogluconolactonase